MDAFTHNDYFNETSVEPWGLIHRPGVGDRNEMIGTLMGPYILDSFTYIATLGQPHRTDAYSNTVSNPCSLTERDLILQGNEGGPVGHLTSTQRNHAPLLYGTFAYEGTINGSLTSTRLDEAGFTNDS